MSYPKVSPWPFIDPDAPPENYLEVGRSVDKARSKTSRKDWRFFVTQGYLIIVRKEWIQFDDDEEGEFAIGQYEYPIAGARWFVNTVERFFLLSDHHDAFPRDKFNLSGSRNCYTLACTSRACIV